MKVNKLVVGQPRFESHGVSDEVQGLQFRFVPMRSATGLESTCAIPMNPEEVRVLLEKLL